MTRSLKITCNYCPWTSYDAGEHLDIPAALAAADEHTMSRHPLEASRVKP